MPTVDETGVWEFESPAVLPAANLTPRLAAAHARLARAEAEYKLVSRDVSHAARAAREAVGTPFADSTFEKVKALQAVSRAASAEWRRAKLAYQHEQHEQRVARLEKRR